MFLPSRSVLSLTVSRNLCEYFKMLEFWYTGLTGGSKCVIENDVGESLSSCSPQKYIYPNTVLLGV